MSHPGGKLLSMTLPALGALDEAISGVLASDTAALGEGAVVAELERLRNRLDAAVVRSVAAFEARGGHEVVGAATVAAWLTHHCRLPSSEAKAQARRGRAEQSLTELGAACAEGSVGPAAAGVLASLLAEPATRPAVEAQEHLLVDQARTLTFTAFCRAIAYFIQLADPDGSEARAEARRARRRVSLVQSFQGTWLGQMTLDPIAGAIVAGELDRLERGLFEVDWREAADDLGRRPLAGELARTATQRRADALVEMARRSASCPSDARFPAPLVSVLVDFPTLSGRVCELANGTVITPGSLLPYLDQALIERAVYKSPVRVEVSTTSRLFSGATRRAIELRDRNCQHPYCDVAADRCQVDHIVPWRYGGPTVQWNGRLACGRHNRSRVFGPDWPPPTTGPPGRN